mmetsp:Transcript_113120/g.325189  ORF Transcript_113120/g.325189 Transcript_113120/m.325189 type:complete len:214 (-) Transcript_113120:478-1119(-)
MGRGAHAVRLLLPAVLLCLLGLEVRVGQPDRLERVLADGIHLRDHPLDGSQDEVVRVRRKQHGCHRENDADEDRGHDAELRAGLDIGPHVEEESKVQVLELRSAHDEGAETAQLNEAQVRGAPHGTREEAIDLAREQGDAYMIKTAVGADLAPRHGQNLARLQGHGPHTVQCTLRLPLPLVEGRRPDLRTGREVANLLELPAGKAHPKGMRVE